jgi:hypothetical protein
MVISDLVRLSSRLSAVPVSQQRGVQDVSRRPVGDRVLCGSATFNLIAYRFRPPFQLLRVLHQLPHALAVTHYYRIHNHLIAQLIFNYLLIMTDTPKADHIKLTVRRVRIAIPLNHLYLSILSVVLRGILVPSV